MYVIVASARDNEYGTGTGGADGDQTGLECSTQDFYVHELGWNLLRPKDKEKAKLIAHNMISICDNNNIGYDLNRRNSLYSASKEYGFDASKVTKKCNTNCAEAIRCSILYSGIECANFWTGDEVDVVMQTGEFNLVTESSKTSDPSFMKVGDILVTKKSGHTVCVVSVEGEDEPEYMNEFEVYSDSKLIGDYLVTSQMNVRLFGGTNMKILGTVKKGEKVKCDGIYAFETSKNKKWCHIYYNGLSGFGSEVLLKRSEGAYGY